MTQHRAVVTLAACGILSVLLCVVQAFEVGFVPRNMVVLGDSLSDSCNVWRRLNTTLGKHYPYPTCPPPPIGRFASGRTWPEALRIAQGQVEVKGGPPGGLPVAGRQNQTFIANLAEAGSTCRGSFYPRSPINLGLQLELLQNNYNGTDLSASVQPPVNAHTDVALMFPGTNDLSFFFLNVSGSSFDPTLITMIDMSKRGTVLDYLGCIFGRFDQLYALGYRRLVLLELLPLELTPFYNPNNVLHPDRGVTYDGIPAVMQQMVLLVNALYPHRVREFEAGHQGARIEIFPTHELFRRFYYHGAEYGFNNVTGYRHGLREDEVAPQDYLWANPLHFGPLASKILGHKIGRFLAGARGDDLLRRTE
ncbi:unnamed protein product [Parajaminaea phylloscopi]